MILGKNVTTGKPVEVPVAADGLSVPVNSANASYSVVTLASGTTNTNSSGASIAQVTTPVTGFGGCYGLSFIADFTGATGGTVDVVIEGSDDGANYYEWHRYTQLAATTVLSKLGPAWTTATSQTNAVAVAKNGGGSAGSPSTTLTIAAESARVGPPPNSLRLRFVIANGVSVGAVYSVRVITYRIPMTPSVP